MSKRKTQIDRAIESLEADLQALIAKYEGERAGLVSAIGKLRQQAAEKPKRKAREQKVVAA